MQESPSNHSFIYVLLNKNNQAANKGVNMHARWVFVIRQPFIHPSPSLLPNPCQGVLCITKCIMHYFLALRNVTKRRDGKMDSSLPLSPPPPVQREKGSKGRDNAKDGYFWPYGTRENFPSPCPSFFAVASRRRGEEGKWVPLMEWTNLLQNKTENKDRG